MKITVLLFIFFPFLSFPLSASGQSPEKETQNRSAGKEVITVGEKLSYKQYVVVRQAVPAYEKAGEKSKIVKNFSLAESVCVVGEQEEFMKVDSWAKKADDGCSVDRDKESQSSSERWIYVKSSNLRPAPEISRIVDPQEIIERAKRQLNTMGYIPVPEDALAPFRQLIPGFQNEPVCKAGKICEKLEPGKQQNDAQ